MSGPRDARRTSPKRIPCVKPEQQEPAAPRPLRERFIPEKQPAEEKRGACEKPRESGAESVETKASEERPRPSRANRESGRKLAEQSSPPGGKAAGGGQKPAAEKSDGRRKAREQSARKAPPRRRVVRAQARYVRTSARKARMVCGHLRGKSVQEARAILAFTPREVARDWSKLLESAVANAESNHELVEDDLFVRDAFADEGPTIKRFRPRAMGRATPIRKRTSHLTIALSTDPKQRTGKRNG